MTWQEVFVKEFYEKIKELEESVGESVKLDGLQDWTPNKNRLAKFFQTPLEI